MTIKNKFDLKGRVAVVTGGAGLLGRAFTRTLAEAGARIVIADQDEPGAAELQETLVNDGFPALDVPTDVTQPASVQGMVKKTMETFGRLDILVNSAALDPKFDPDHRTEDEGAFETFPLEAWKRALDVDLTGMFLCCQAASQPMLAARQGTIINLSSIYGLVAPDQRMYQRPGQPPQYKPVPYAVTKAGVLGLTRYLATYFAGKNIRVNALSPGGVFNNHDDAFVEAYAARAVMGRMAEVEDVQGALLFLASDASAYMTGANLVVDGGWSTW